MAEFLCGVIEGFYGRPWTQAQRLELFGWMDEWRLNTYVYAPKDDLKARAAWRERYSDSEIAELRTLVSHCEERGIAFVYALSPGLDIRYADPQELRALEAKVEQLIDAGAAHFCLLFDDIPAELSATDAARFTSFGAAQAYVANALFAHVRQRVNGLFLFCPTVYCARMAESSVRGSSYLKDLGERLHGEIDVFWTGPEIVSEEISERSILELQEVLGRKPLVWDNLHANDYDIRRLYLGPFAGRPEALRGEVRGVLSNPNNEFEANFVPLKTLSSYVHSDAYEAHHAHKEALKAWLPRFNTHGAEVVLGDLELLGDLFYLFFKHGEHAEAILQNAERVLAEPPERWGDALTDLERSSQDVQRLFRKLTELENRDLLYSLYAYVWEIEHELRYLVRYLAWVAQGKPGRRFSRPNNLANTFRGGLAADIERLLPLSGDGIDI